MGASELVRRLVRATAAIVLALAAAACGDDSSGPAATPAGSEAWFVEEAAARGVEFVTVPFAEPRFHFPEIMLGGVGLLDADDDGWLDLYLVQGGDLARGPSEAWTNRLYHNRAGGEFADVTEASGAGDRGYGMGCACADADGDGDTDLFVTNVGADALLRNEGSLRFADATREAGVGDERWGTSAAFADLDADGDLDLFVATYVRWSPALERECRSLGNRRDYCDPSVYEPDTDVLYRNRGDGVFEDVSVASGIASAPGSGLGVVAGDFDRDGRTDVYVANDGMENRLWRNLGGWRFADEALVRGVAVNGAGRAEAGMGVAAVDVEDDGDLDLFVSHLRNQTNTLYLGGERGVFADRTAAWGLAASSRPYTGFGLGFADFDHDGALDLFVANGRVTLEAPFPDAARPYAEPNLLYRGAGGRFVELAPRGGTLPELVETSRGAALGDLDGDGGIDVVVANVGGPARILRNVAGARGSWILLRLRERSGGDAIGATATIELGGRRVARRVDPSSGYLSSHDPRVHFGLGTLERVDSVAVRWADGEEERFGPLAAGRVHVLARGEGAR